MDPDEEENIFLNGFPVGGHLQQLQGRLESALSTLRAQCCSRSTEETEDRIRKTEDSGSKSRSGSLNRIREVTKLLAQSRTREAELQDKIDSLKCDISDFTYRVRELESIVDEWRIRYEGESFRCASLIRERESWISEREGGLQRPGTEVCEGLRKRGTASAPASLNLSSGYIPDVCEAFRLANHSPPVFHY